MKKLLLFILLSFSLHQVFSQTVENIRVDPDGDKINIHYRIGGSLEGDEYNVSLECSIDGGPRFMPKAVMGDVGKNIRGGKSNYTIIWDVFDDLEEVGNAEFFIAVERVGGAAPQYQQPGPFTGQPESFSGQEEQSRMKPQGISPVDYRKVMLNYEISYNSLYGIWNFIGVKAGTLGNWGFYSTVRIGYDYYWESLTGSLLAGATKRIVNRPKYRLHGYTGLGIGDYFDVFNFEFGVSNVISNRVVIDFGFEIPTWYAATVLGIGIVF